MVDVFGGKSNDTLSPLSHIIFIKKAATANAFVTLNGFSSLNLQQGSISNVCTFKLWYGLGWQMKWTQLNAWGRQKENQFVSIMTKKNAAPHEPLKIIHCNCLGECKSSRCSYRRYELQCTLHSLHCCMWPLPNWKLWQSKQHSRGRYWRGGWHSELNALKLW